MLAWVPRNNWTGAALGAISGSVASAITDAMAHDLAWHMLIFALLTGGIFLVLAWLFFEPQGRGPK